MVLSDEYQSFEDNVPSSLMVNITKVRSCYLMIYIRFQYIRFSLCTQLMNIYFSIKLCGKQSIRIWDEDIQDFGECFTSLFLVAPAHAFLAIASAYYLGSNAPTYYIRTRYQKVALYIRTIVIFFLAACPALAASLLMCLDTAVLSDLGWSGNMEAVIQTFSWCLHLHIL